MQVLNETDGYEYILLFVYSVSKVHYSQLLINS